MTYFPTPITVRAVVPETKCWVNLEPYFGTRITDLSIEPANPGGLAKASFTMSGEVLLRPGAQIGFWDGCCPIGGGEVESSEPDPTSRTTKVTVRGPIVTMSDGLIYDKTYIKSGIAGANDSRAVAGVAVNYKNGAQLDVSENKVTITHPWATPCATNEFAGFWIDLGPNNGAKRVSFRYQSSANTANHTWFTWNDATNGDGTVRDEDIAGLSNIPLSAAFPGPSQTGGDFTIARRIFGMFVYCVTGYTPGAHVFLNIDNLTIATDTSYMTVLGVSLLTVDMVAKDIVTNAAIPNISTRTDLIATGTIPMQELISGGDNPRSLLDRANAADGMQWRYTPDAVPALQIRAVPTAAQWVLRPGEYSIAGGQASSIEDVYNQVKVYWTSIDGAQNVTTVTLTPDTTLLASLGRVRCASVKISRFCNSAEAAGIGARFLRENSTPPVRANLQINCGYIRDASGARCSLGLVQAGDRIRILGMRDAATGLNTREGLIFGGSIQPRAQTATFSLDNDHTIFDRQLALFESQGKN